MSLRNKVVISVISLLFLILFTILIINNLLINEIKSKFLQISQSYIDFGVKVFKTLSSNNENTIISPISLSIAFGMIYFGSNGETANSLSNVLGFNKSNLKDEDLFNEFKQLLIHLKSNNTENYELKIENRVILNKGFNILYDYKQSLQQGFDADILSYDLVNDEQNARLSINNWMNETMNGKIPPLLDEPIDKDLVLMLLNVVYFKNKWLMPFDKDRTSNRNFYNNGVDKVDVLMMFNRQHLNYFRSEELSSQIIELPFIGNEFSFIVILPEERNIFREKGLNPLKSVLNYENLSKAFKSMKSTDIDLYLPKFKFQKTYSLKETLKSIGINNVFESADFSRIDGTKELIVSKFNHKVVIDVMEEGIEATAKTLIYVNDYSNGDSQSALNQFKADHPFLFIIRDNRNEIILFLGQISEL